MPLDQQDYQPWTKANPRPLPDELSDLIFLAVEDLERAEASPHYSINMSQWHRPLKSGKCEVCFAGVVMAFSLGGDTRVDRAWDSPVDRKMMALNAIRDGLVTEALGDLFPDDKDVDWPHERIVLYECAPALFKDQMRGLAGRLAAAGY